MEIRTLEVSGFASAFQALRLPHNGAMKSKVLSHIDCDNGLLNYRTTVEVDERDIKLMMNLQKSGDHHAKVLRGILAYAEINAPIYFWWDLETYEVGHQRLSSGSTMHTECKGLYGEELQKVKGAIPFGRMIKKVDYFSYQTLRRIAYQRHNHRLPEFREMIEWMHTLPYAEELIFAGLSKENGDPALPNNTK